MKKENEQFELNFLENFLPSSILNEDNMKKNIINSFNNPQLDLGVNEKKINCQEKEQVSPKINLIILIPKFYKIFSCLIKI